MLKKANSIRRYLTVAYQSDNAAKWIPVNAFQNINENLENGNLLDINKINIAIKLCI